MTDVQQESEQIVEVAVPEVSLPGVRLRETREAGRMSREEVAQHLHLDVQIITALEQDNYNKLPSPMYVCGYLRSYARLLKLPEMEIVSAYTKGKEINAALIPENVNILPGKKPFNPAILKTGFLILIAAAVVAGLIWLSDETDFFNVTKNSDKNVEMPLAVPERQEIQAAEVTEPLRTSDQEVVQDLTPPSAQEIEQKIAQQEETSAEPSTAAVIDAPTRQESDLRLVLHEDSWIEVTDSDAIRHVYRLVKAGSELYVAGKAPYKVLLGKASGVEVYYKDKVFDHARFQRDEIAYFRIGVAE